MIIEEYVRSGLVPLLDVPVYCELPDVLPETFVLIDHISSDHDGDLIRTLVAIQSYAPSKYQAAQLNETVKEQAPQLVDDDRITRFRCSSDNPFPDTEIKKHRYQAVFEVIHY